MVISNIDAKAQLAFPETVVAFTNAENDKDPYLSSPSIVIMPDGSYIVSYDRKIPLTTLQKSTDKGKTWSKLAEVPEMRWATLFYHSGALYLIGLKNVNQQIRIVKSVDGGKTWSKPVNDQTGIILEGMYHTGPVPVVIHKNRIWRTFEQVQSPTSRQFAAFVMSAPINSDLLKADSWTKSDSLYLNPDWVNGDKPTWLEGNIVVDPKGKLLNFTRVDMPHKGGEFELKGAAEGKQRFQTAMKISISDDGKKLSFNNTKRDFVDFPGADSKFTIRYDSVSKKYWTIVNKITNTKDGTINRYKWQPNQRNVLMLMSSSDLVKWDFCYKVIRWAEGRQITNRDVFGFQYVDWQIEGNDIVAVSRTAWYGKWYHDANFITFHRIENFRDKKLSDSPEDMLKYTEKQTLLGWNFANPVTTGKEEGLNSTKTNDKLEVSALKRGKGIVSNHLGLEGSFFSYAKEWPNSLQDALKANTYYEIKVQPKEGYSICVSAINLKIRRNAEGPTRYMWHYSLDGTYFYPTGRLFMPVTQTAPFGVVEPKIYLSGVNALQNVSWHHPIYFRLYIWTDNQKNTNGSFSIGRNVNNDTSYSLSIEGDVSNYKSK